MVWLIFDSSPSGQHIYSRRDAQQEGEETLSVFVAELSFFQAQPRAESGGKRTHSCLQLHRALGALGAQSREQKAGRVFTAFFSVDFTVSLVCSLISSLTPQAFIVPLNWVSSVLSHPTPAYPFVMVEMTYKVRQQRCGPALGLRQSWVSSSGPGLIS